MDRPFIVVFLEIFCLKCRTITNIKFTDKSYMRSKHLFYVNVGGGEFDKRV